VSREIDTICGNSDVIKNLPAPRLGRHDCIEPLGFTIGEAAMLPIESGLAVLVPEAEFLVRPFRAKYDPSAAAGMLAHITLLYPFKPPDEIGEAVIEKLTRCFAGFRSFDFSLTTTRRFPGGVLYLAPEPDEPFRRLTLAIWDCFPATPPYGGRYSNIVPHLTVAELSVEREVERTAAEFARTAEDKLPIRAIATEIALMDTQAGSWQVRTALALR
jgi:2'-5' RNA ligase